MAQGLTGGLGGAAVCDKISNKYEVLYVLLLLLLDGRLSGNAEEVIPSTNGPREKKPFPKGTYVTGAGYNMFINKQK